MLAADINKGFCGEKLIGPENASAQQELWTPCLLKSFSIIDLSESVSKLLTEMSTITVRTHTHIRTQFCYMKLYS